MLGRDSMTSDRTETCPDCGAVVEVREFSLGLRLIEKRVCRGCFRNTETDVVKSSRDWRNAAPGAEVARFLFDWASDRIGEIAAGQFELARAALRRCWEADFDPAGMPEVERRKAQIAVAVALDSLRDPGARPALAIAELESIRALVTM